MSYNSKYKGSEVEELLDQIANGNTGGGGSVYPVVNMDIEISTYTLQPNTFYVWEMADSLDLTLGDETEGVMNEYLFQFTAGSTTNSLTLPDAVTWAEDGIYAIIPGYTYRVSIINNLARMTKFFREQDELIMPMTLFIKPGMDTSPIGNPKAAQLYQELMSAKDDNGIVSLEEGMLYVNIYGSIQDDPISLTELKWGAWSEGLNDRTETGFHLTQISGSYILVEDGTIYYLYITNVPV